MPNFLKTTLLGGLLFLVPGVVLIMIISKALEIIRKVIDPLAESLNIESVVGLQTPVALAIIFLVLVCFVAGILAKTPAGDSGVKLVESILLSKIPGYDLLKSTSASMVGAESNSEYPVVVFRLDDAWQLGLKIEDMANDLVVVFVPDTPNPQSGSVLFVKADRVVPTDIPLASCFSALKRRGRGFDKLLQNTLASGNIDTQGRESNN